MLKGICIVCICVLAGTSAQPLADPGDIGVYDGRLLGLDSVDGPRLQHLTAALGIERQVRLGHTHDDLRRFGPGIAAGPGFAPVDKIGVDPGYGRVGKLGPGPKAGHIDPGFGRVDKFGPGPDFGDKFGPGPLTGLGGQFGPGLGVMPLDSFGGLRLPQCPLNVCTRQFIPRRCRYTPVIRTKLGQYCLGCDEDVCPPEFGSGRGRRLSGSRSRRERRQRQLCRTLGRCYGREGGGKRRSKGRKGKWGRKGRGGRRGRGSPRGKKSYGGREGRWRD